MRIVITVPDIPPDPAEAAEVLRGVIPDLERVASVIAAEIGPELKPGQHGWTSGSDPHELRLHWSVRDDEGRGYIPPAGDKAATS
jgi:hypothetical protein